MVYNGLPATHPVNTGGVGRVAGRIRENDWCFCYAYIA